MVGDELWVVKKKNQMKKIRDTCPIFKRKRRKNKKKKCTTNSKPL